LAVADELDPQLVAGAIDILAGHQIISFYEAYHLLGGKGDPDLMPVIMRKGLLRLLGTLGYRERWASEKDGDDFGFMWTRVPWPGDVGRIDETKPWIPIKVTVVTK
jgi:hypothetical protein